MPGRRTGQGRAAKASSYEVTFARPVRARWTRRRGRQIRARAAEAPVRIWGQTEPGSPPGTVNARRLVVAGRRTDHPCQISDDRWRDRRKSRVSDRSTPQPPPRSANASEPGTTVVARRARHGRRRGGERESTVAARRMRCRNATLTRSSRSRASGSSAASRRDGSARCSCSGTASSGATPCVR